MSIKDQTADPDMRFTPRSHLFLLPAHSPKADFAKGLPPRAIPLTLIDKIGRFRSLR
jgi:hypothetical protein